MSRAVPRLATIAVLSLVWVLAPAALADDKPKDETPSEKARKALDQPIDLDLKESSLAKVIARFHEKTKLDITFDRSPLVGLMGIDPNADMPQPIEGKFKATKVRDALRKVFEPYGLRPFIVDEAVLLTSEEIGVAKQLKQRVDVDVDDVPLTQALKQLGRRKAINLVVDQKATKQAEKKVSLQVDDVAVETAVRLLAEQAGLKAARIDNVLYVTTPEQAASIAAENRANVPNPYWPYGPYGQFIGGPGGVGILGGGLGALGIAGGGGGIGGLGGLGGGGGIMGVPPPRLLPPPPLPAAPPVPKEAPAKPTSQVPPQRLAIAAADYPAAPAPFTGPRPEAWAWVASRPTVGARRTHHRRGMGWGAPLDFGRGWAVGG
jgi:hypothetical protein